MPAAMLLISFLLLSSQQQRNPAAAGLSALCVLSEAGGEDYYKVR
jgi:hypothetical protein